MCIIPTLVKTFVWPSTQDTPPRAFSETYYPNLCALYRRVGIPSEPARLNFSCTIQKLVNGGSYNSSGGCNVEAVPFFSYRLLRLGSLSFPHPLDIGRLCLRYSRLIFDAGRFYLRSPAHLFTGRIGRLSLGEYVDSFGYGADFVDNILLPMLTGTDRHGVLFLNGDCWLPL